MDIEGCIVKEIIVQPLLGSNFEEAITRALVYAIEHDVNVTIANDERSYRIVPRSIIQSIFRQTE